MPSSFQVVRKSSTCCASPGPTGGCGIVRHWCHTNYVCMRVSGTADDDPRCFPPYSTWQCSDDTGDHAYVADSSSAPCGSSVDACFDFRPHTPCCFSGEGCRYVENDALCNYCGGAPPIGDVTSCTPDPCVLTPCCLPEYPYACEMMHPGTCVSLGGLVAQDGTLACEEDTCNNACCYHRYPGDTFCSVNRAHSCKDQGGTTQWGEKTCDPNPCFPPGACCLCREQCLDLPEGSCDVMGGTWHQNMTCEVWQQRPGECPASIKPKCRHARFRITQDIHSNPHRYRPLSTDKMDPHEYQHGLPNANCRTWWGNVSAAHGAWGCGQWDMDHANTKQYFRLAVKLLSDGRGELWTTYRPVCPEYS